MQNLNHCEMMKKLDMEMEACAAQIDNRTTGLCFSNYYDYLLTNFVGLLATEWQNEILRQQNLLDSLRLHIAPVGSRLIGCLLRQTQSKSHKSAELRPSTFVVVSFHPERLIIRRD